jgi:hypothetical protein
LQQVGGLRGFVQRAVGRSVLLALAILVTFATYVYLSTLLAIPVLLLVGLAVPIWLGIKRIRTLALFGLIILLLVAPIATVVITQDVRTPVPPTNSPVLPGTNGSLMQNASVSPYLGSTSTNFTWTVTVNPAYTPKGNSTPEWIYLYLSTCPGATAPTDINCNAGYPFWAINYTLPSPFTHPVNVTWRFQFPSDSIWAWQMGLFMANLSAPANSSSSLTFVLLTGDPVYNGIEGPVTGDFGSTYTLLVLTVYLNDLIYLGIPYYVVLLVYAFISRRRQARADALQRAAGPTSMEPGAPPLGSRPSTDSPSTAANRPPAAPRRPEMNCPQCGAVVYPNETKCWKCGAAIPPAPPSDAPLASGPKNG